MLQSVESNVVRLLHKHGKLTSPEYQKITGSRSLPSIVLNINNKFDRQLIKSETQHTKRVTFSWNRSDDARTITYFYLNKNWESMVNKNLQKQDKPSHEATLEMGHSR